ncbi:hypothetical protein AtNW77_Chr1g0082601 [Arabidopsis thaliana]
MRNHCILFVTYFKRERKNWVKAAGNYGSRIVQTTFLGGNQALVTRRCSCLIWLVQS